MFRVYILLTILPLTIIVGCSQRQKVVQSGLSASSDSSWSPQMRMQKYNMKILAKRLLIKSDQLKRAGITGKARERAIDAEYEVIKREMKTIREAGGMTKLSLQPRT